jgi:anaphase-promoting complex subunit 4
MLVCFFPFIYLHLITNSCTEGPSYLLNFPFQPASAQKTPEKADTPSLVLTYADCDTNPTNAKPTAQATPLDLTSLIQTGMVRHAFAVSGPKAKPVHLDVNGRKGRRAVCVLYGDGMRYDVLDLDAAMENEEVDEEVEAEAEEAEA